MAYHSSIEWTDATWNVVVGCSKVVDAGEWTGFITINRSTRKGRTYFGAVIGVSGTRRQPHDLAASLWGGTVWLYTPKDPTQWRPTT